MTLLIAAVAASGVAGGGVRTGIHRENGWYHITPGRADSIAPRPVLAVKEFMYLRLDTNVFGYPMIAGQTCRHKQKAWADATEQAIGCRIGLVIDDTVVTAPRVNCRIESGAFAISTPDGRGLATLYSRLLAEKRDTLMRICAHRNGRNPFRGLDPGQCDSLANTMDYHDVNRR